MIGQSFLITRLSFQNDWTVILVTGKSFNVTEKSFQIIGQSFQMKVHLFQMTGRSLKNDRKSLNEYHAK